MSRFVLAPDSFKESMTAIEAAQAMRLGVLDADPGAECLECPMADGGEGFAQVLAAALGARSAEAAIHDALGRPTTGSFHLAGSTAILDAATAVGLGMIAPDERDVMASDTRGVGELVGAALDAGARRIIIGLGGTATNDGGAGMLRALGARFLDGGGEPLDPSPLSLGAADGPGQLAGIDASGLDPRLAEAEILAACDVRSPLLGPQGASAVFGPQKGASSDQVERLDRHLARLAELSGSERQAIASCEGAGAAGGLGWAIMAFLGGVMRPGVEILIEATGLERAAIGATAVLTGEGSADAQTLQGKTAAGVARAARAAGSPVVILAGRIDPSARALLDEGVSALVPITPEGTPLERALAEGAANLRAATARWVRERLGG